MRAAAVQRLCKRSHADYDATHLSLLHDDGCNIACVTSSLDVISSALSQTNQVSCMVAGTISESFLKPSMTPDVAGGAHQTDGKAKHAKADDSCVCNRLAHIQRTTFRVSTCSHSDNQQSVEQTPHTARSHDVGYSPLLICTATNVSAFRKLPCRRWSNLRKPVRSTDFSWTIAT